MSWVYIFCSFDLLRQAQVDSIGEYSQQVLPVIVQIRETNEENARKNVLLVRFPANDMM